MRQLEKAQSKTTSLGFSYDLDERLEFIMIKQKDFERVKNSISYFVCV